MKNVRLFLVLLLAGLLAAPMFMEAKVSRGARREAFRLARVGWKAFPNTLPIKEQLQQSYDAQYDFDNNSVPRYIVAEATSDFCPSLEEAEKQADALARINLLGSYATECLAIVELTYLDNKQVQDENVNAVVDAMASRNSFYGFRVESTVGHDNVNAVSVTSTAMYYGDDLLIENAFTEDGECVSNVYWESIVKYGNVEPYQQNAWRLLRFYRKTAKGYQALIRVCNYAPKVEK